MRAPLAKICKTLVSTDIAPLQTEALANETFIEADLGDYAVVKSVMEGAEIVVHFGGHPDEKPFDEILHANIIGCYNVWDTAYHAGARRIVYASQHAVAGIQRQRQLIHEASTDQIATAFQQMLCRRYG